MGDEFNRITTINKTKPGDSPPLPLNSCGRTCNHSPKSKISNDNCMSRSADRRKARRREKSKDISWSSHRSVMFFRLIQLYRGSQAWHKTRWCFVADRQLMRLNRWCCSATKLIKVRTNRHCRCALSLYRRTPRQTNSKSLTLFNALCFSGKVSKLNCIVSMLYVPSFCFQAPLCHTPLILPL